MDNNRPSLLLNIWAAGLEEIPSWVWGVSGIILTVILGYWYAKKLSNQTEQNIVEKLEHCIDEKVRSDDKIAGSFCKEVVEDAKRLQNATSNYERGLSKATLGDLYGAEAEFNTGIDLQQPVLSKYYFQRGNIRYLQKKFEESCMDYSEAIRINPQYIDAWNHKGVTLYQWGKYDEAILAFDKSIEINPRYVPAWNNKGETLRRQGKYDEAILAFDKAIEIKPRYAPAWNNKGITLGQLGDLGQQGKYDEAIQCLDKAIDIDPKYAQAWNNRGKALKLLGRTAEADAAFTKAKEFGYNESSIAWYI